MPFAQGLRDINLTHLMRLADRVLNRPLLITPDKADIILAVLGNRIGINSPTLGLDDNALPNIERTPYRVLNGVPVISVFGSLVNRGSHLDAQSGVTSYESISSQIKLAKKEQSNTVIFDFNTPGGEAVGAFECAADILELSKTKRTIAIVNGMACSAGYALASACSEIVTVESGITGSIGVILVHADFSKKLESEGIDYSMIFKGSRKKDANPFEPLSEDVKSSLQDEVNTYYDMFIKTVAKGRGARLNTSAARATEARTYIGQAAVEAGLADRIGTLESVLTDLSRASKGRTNHPTVKGTKMDENTGAPAAEKEAGISKEVHDLAVTAAFNAGSKAATTRMQSILTAEGVKDNPARIKAAIDLAATSDMSAEAIVGFVGGHVLDAALKPSASLQNRAPAAIITGAEPVKTSDGWKSVSAKINSRFAQ